VQEASDAGGTGRLEEPGHRQDVAAEVPLEVLPAARQPRHRRFVDDGLDAVERRLERVGPEVEAVEREARPAEQAGEVAPFTAVE
jgi:hypothetical protein